MKEERESKDTDRTPFIFARTSPPSLSPIQLTAHRASGERFVRVANAVSSAGQAFADSERWGILQIARQSKQAGVISVSMSSLHYEDR